MVDRFKHLFWDKYDIEFHRNVIKRIKEENFPYAQEAENSIFISENGTVDFDKNKIEIICADAANLPLKDKSIDLIFSNAVLEHIHNIHKAVYEMSRITKEGGLGIHQIDLRDHFSKSYPLRLLQYPDWLWNLMSWNRPGYTNRLRLSDFENLFKTCDFKIKKIVYTREYENQIVPLKMNKKFKKYSYDELKVLSFFLIAEKIAKPF